MLSVYIPGYQFLLKNNWPILTKIGTNPQETQTEFITMGFLSSFGGLDVACWPLVPKFAGSNPAEAVRFSGLSEGK